jgi:hypothetical protein
MATNYPTSVDSFTDPTAVDTMDGLVGGSAVYHDVQHTNLNDAVTALENQLGITGAFNFLLMSGTKGTFNVQIPSNPTATVAGLVIKDSGIPTNTTRVMFENDDKNGAPIAYTLNAGGAYNATDNINMKAPGGGLVTNSQWVGPEYGNPGTFLAVSGTAALPGISFYADTTGTASDAGTGFYLISNGVFGISASQTSVATVSSTALTMALPIAMGSNKITGLANGTASTDAAAFGQIPYLAAPQVFTGNGTWTPSTTGSAIFVATVVGGGGAGGVGGTSIGGGGGGGGEVLQDFYLGNVVGSQGITVGAASSGAGNSTSIGALVTAAGGGVGGAGTGTGVSGIGGDGQIGAFSTAQAASGTTGGFGGATSNAGSRGGAGLSRFASGGGGGGGPTSGTGGKGGGSAGGAGGTGAAAGGGGGGGGGGGVGNNGGAGTGGNGANAPANTGCGGGGGGAGTAGGTGGNGGSGYIIIRQVA